MARVTVGIPIYRGERYLEESLQSVRKQTYKDFEVLMSVDGPDPACEKICSEFLGDSRFKLVVQPERLGWVGNLNWLMAQVTTDFWYYHQQDDLVEANYIEVLIEYADKNPRAALVYSDLLPFGRIEGRLEQPSSVLGATAYMRQMTILHEHWPAFALRGLIRREVLRAAGEIPTNDIDNFTVDITWLASVAHSGELHHVPMELYRKRYHDKNTELRWWVWPREKRVAVWPCHCVYMLEQALRVSASAMELRLLWLAAVERLVSPQVAGHFLPVAELTHAERATMLELFMDRARASTVHNIPVLLDADWDAIDEFTRAFYWLPNRDLVEITEFGPQPVNCGEPFNRQPDGSSAIWVCTARRAPPGSKIKLGDLVLDTVLEGTVLTARVPVAVTERVGRLELVLVGPDGSRRSKAAKFKIRDKSIFRFPWA